MMAKDKTEYKKMAKHIYVAYPTYSTIGAEVIILADDEGEAQKKAVEHFQRSIISVKPLEGTRDPQIYTIF